MNSSHPAPLCPLAEASSPDHLLPAAPCPRVRLLNSKSNDFQSGGQDYSSKTPKHRGIAAQCRLPDPPCLPDLQLPIAALGRCAKEVRLLRDRGAVGSWIGCTEIYAGFAVVKDCLAAPHL